MAEAANAFVPVFIDTLDRSKPFLECGEIYGSYPVLRVQRSDGADLAGRLDGNPLAGAIPVEEVLGQLERGLAAFSR